MHECRTWLEHYQRLAEPQRHIWLQQHPPCLQCIAELKHQSDQHLRVNGQLADWFSQAAIEAALASSDPEIQALADWARGNWAIYHDHQQVFGFYEQALSFYRKQTDNLSIARLLGNLVGAYADRGDFKAAEAAYAEAKQRYQGFDLSYQLVLEQNYGIVLSRHRHYPAALACFSQAIVMAHQLSLEDRVLENSVNQALIFFYQGQFRQSEAGLLNSYRLAQALDHGLTIARIAMNLAEVYANLGQPALAIDYFKQARLGFQHQHAHMEQGSVWLREGQLFERLGSFGAAIQVYQAAINHFEQHAMQPQVAEAYARLAIVFRATQAFDQANQALLQAQQRWQALDHQSWLLTIRLEQIALALAQKAYQLAETELAQLQLPDPTYQYHIIGAYKALAAEQRFEATQQLAAFQQATEHYQQLLAYAQQEQHQWLARDSYAGLGRLAYELDPIQALTAFDQALTHEKAIRQALSVEELKASFHAQAYAVYHLPIAICRQLRRWADLLNYVWHYKGSALAEIIHAKSQLQINPLELQQLNQLRQLLASRRWEYGQRSGFDPEFAAEILSLEQQIQTLRRERNNQAFSQPSFGTLPMVFQQHQASCLIEFYTDQHFLYALRIEQNGSIQHYRLVDLNQLKILLIDLQLSFRNVLTLTPTQLQQQLTMWQQESLALLGECFDCLIRPLGSFKLHSQILISPCDPLYLVPFAALWDGQAYFGTNVKISLTICAGICQPTKPPEYSDSQLALLIGASAEGKLEQIEAEISAIQAILPKHQALFDHPDDYQCLSQLETSPRYLHIAAHSILRFDAPIFSAIQLKGGVFAVEQCYELPLNASELVVLSGCTTATGLDTGGSLLAFQSAFFVAGVGHVISSLWETHDQATMLWMQSFYQGLTQGLDVPQAIQTSQAWLRQHPLYNHPAFWAVFSHSRI
ncbi:CHAT domain-containing protein [Herpetosiphon gulosus]|uniref:CHAT domain-containing protein n=1 Tax=Herpetosiphon gulosus TaxID=1973496 RepID=A0ABP9X492_9CHLR